MSAVDDILESWEDIDDPGVGWLLEYSHINNLFNLINNVSNRVNLFYTWNLSSANFSKQWAYWCALVVIIMLINVFICPI